MSLTPFLLSLSPSPSLSLGRDTTAQALSWMFYLLHRSNSDASIVPKLEKEVDEVLAGENPSYETFKKMKYSEAWYASWHFT